MPILFLLKVDIYGACGTKRCSKAKNGTSDCFSMVEKDYNFYLSFENSLCTDYVTEKFFNALNYDVVPVVMGGARYADIAPHKSFVSVHDFKNDPGALARHLAALERSSEAYAQYFWWKDYYEVLQGPRERAKTFCDICQRLHAEDSETKVYEDMEEWWERKGKCRHLRIRT